MLVTDAQVHIWENDRADRPWPTESRVTPHRETALEAEEMLAEMDRVGVDRAVIVPPSWIGENNATGLEAAAAYPARLAVMGRFDPEAPDARAQLAGWLAQPGMLGIRLTFNTPRFQGWLEDGTLDWFWAETERLGIPLMTFFAGRALLEKVPPIAERHPGLTLIIDHMGMPTNKQGPDAFADLDALLALARYPKVLVKTTSAPSYSAESYPYRDIHPFLRRIYDAFGARRLLWGSDITRLRGTYRECLALFQEALDFLSDEDREWILGKTAAEALHWPETVGRAGRG
jgi:predicted TIM-barrel fold metal-dependent hydrolase